MSGLINQIKSKGSYSELTNEKLKEVIEELFDNMPTGLRLPIQIRIDAYAEFHELSLDDALEELENNPNALPMDIPGWWQIDQSSKAS